MAARAGEFLNVGGDQQMHNRPDCGGAGHRRYRPVGAARLRNQDHAAHQGRDQRQNGQAAPVLAQARTNTPPHCPH